MADTISVSLSQTAFRIFICLGFLCSWLFGVKAPLLGQTQPVRITYLLDTIYLDQGLAIYQDSTHTVSLEDILSWDDRFHPYEEWEKPLDYRSTYWGRVTVDYQFDDTSQWIINTHNNGFAEVFIIRENEEIIHQKAGKYLADAEKEITTGHEVFFNLTLYPGEQVELIFKVREIDHFPPDFKIKLIEFYHWHTLDHDPKENMVLFFQGIFWVMLLYNFILFFSTGFRAYLYYALYLLSVALFVLVAVGSLQSPPFGDPVWHQQIGYLAFGAINIFYFLFGRSLLDTKTIIPRWDRFIKAYVVVKAIVLLILQIVIFLTFNLKDVLAIEFAMFFLDNLISLGLFIALARTGSVLARFFIIGSSAVMIIGLSLAVLGHLYAIQNSFATFLSTIVVEIICFSLALGYKMRQNERLKLKAEQEKVKAQEALNLELSKVNTAFGRFVPHEFLKSLGYDTILDVKLGDQVEKEVTVFFSDIRAYTTLSEQMSPRDNFNFLNAYLGRVGPIIKDHDGFVNQYYGDGIMALFMRSAQDAVTAAIQIHERLKAYNIERESKGRIPLKIGIGLHTGPLMMGVIGDTLRMEAGVVSNTVNTAARMEGLTKYFFTSTLISEYTLKRMHAPEHFSYRFLGIVIVKGQETPIKVYDFFDGDPNSVIQLKQQTKADFEHGLQCYFQKSFIEAAKAFDKVLAIDPEDKVCQRYKEYTTQYIVEGVSESWSGIETMSYK
ncbi:MAG: 7TM diverse intracellular signaling domain-containing protein [Bacteroidia bacterium]